MNIPIKTKNEVATPPNGYVFPFIDAATEKFTVKLSTGEFVTFSSGTDLPEDFKPLDFTDYTAFEVYPHNNDIPVGNHEVLGNIKEMVPAEMNYRFVLWSKFAPADNNVVIDWGDGSEVTELSMFENISDSDTTLESLENKYAGNINAYLLNHKYTETGKFTVKIYGNTYYSILNGLTLFRNNEGKVALKYVTKTETEFAPYRNLVCNVFGSNLPVASHLNNFSGFAACAHLLTNVTIKSETFYNNATNVSQMFYQCSNLQSVTGFTEYNKIGACVNVFNGCKNLATCDFKLPAIPVRQNDIYYAFTNCESLTGNVRSFLPTNGFKTGSAKLNVGYLFQNCKNLTISDIDTLGLLLWNDTKTNFIGTVDTNGIGVFTGCSDNLRAQVPVLWGGTNTSIVVKPFIQKQIDKIDKQIESIENELEDYTAFEVDANSQQTFGTVITLTKPAAECDVIIDFGDKFGKIALKDMKSVVNDGDNGRKYR